MENEPDNGIPFEDSFVFLYGLEGNLVVDVAEHMRTTDVLLIKMGDKLSFLEGAAVLLPIPANQKVKVARTVVWHLFMRLFRRQYLSGSTKFF